MDKQSKQLNYFTITNQDDGNWQFVDSSIMQDTAEKILAVATKFGASSSIVEINENISQSVNILDGNIDTFETNRSFLTNFTVYNGKKKASVGFTGIIDDIQIESFVKRAVGMIKFAEVDEANGLPDLDTLCLSLNLDHIAKGHELSLYHENNLDNYSIIDRVKNLEYQGLDLPHQRLPSSVLNQYDFKSNGAGFSYSKSNFILASTDGMMLGYPSSYSSIWLSMIGKHKHDADHECDVMHADYWSSSARSVSDLLTNDILAHNTIMRLARRLNKNKIVAGKHKIIFEHNIAKTIINGFLSAISGGVLYRKLTFLSDSINTQIFANHINIIEDPFVPKGHASSYFDDEGVAVKMRALVTNGVLNGYLLSSYTARKMQLKTTGNAGGAHNIVVQPNFYGNLDQLAKEMHTGLIIIEIIGNGLNMVTGDISVGASGLWVEQGEICYFVDNITISSNLKTIFSNILLVADDIQNQWASIRCGSIMVDSNVVQVSC